MLVLGRKEGESITIQRDGFPPIQVMIVRIRDGYVRVGVEAPMDVKIDRNEVLARGRCNN